MAKDDKVKNALTTVWKPVKDANGMTQGFEEVEVDSAKLEKTSVPGGLAAPIAY